MALKASTRPENKKHPFYFYAIIILIPILFFICLEFTLRFFNYGFSNEQWVSVTSDKLMLNPEVARRYFHTTKNLPFSIQDLFNKDKKQNAFRIFILGESSGAGYPYMPLGSFSRWLKTRLEVVYPNCTIEVVNLSMTAISSYALRDIFPGVFEQKPDLILIYSGHNEYYGALGIGSMESFGSSRSVVNLILYLNKFKTVELLRNTIIVVSKLFSKDTGKQDGTLMSRIAKDQLIDFESEVFNKGIEQYENNMRDIFTQAKKYNVPIILGTLVNNLKDQPPFISVNSGDYPSAVQIFKQAREELKNEHFKTADSLFRLAKDLDVLRFRSSEKMNKLIKQLGNEFKYPVAQIDSAFSEMSPDGIVGDNLMTDHLHPTLQGYRLMAKLYFEKMIKMNYLPKCSNVQFSDSGLDSAMDANFKFTKFDSIIADYRIRILKNDWPYIDKKDKKNLSDLLNPKDFLETTAFEILNDDLSWEIAQRRVAGWYLSRKDYDSFQDQMDNLISQYPVIVEYYDFVANEFLKIGKYDLAYTILLNRYNIEPDAYSSKWLVIIALSKNNTDTAIKYLEESLTYKKNDPQVLYNLSGAYSYKKDFQKSLDIINRCLAISPDFPNAQDLKKQLQAALR